MALREAAESARQEMAGLPRVVWVLAGGSFINNFGSFVVPFLVLYLLHRGYGGGLAAGAVSAYAAGKIAAGPAGGMLTDRLGPRAVTAGSMAGLAAATTLALAAVPGPARTMATAAVCGLVSQLYRPATQRDPGSGRPGPAAGTGVRCLPARRQRRRHSWARDRRAGGRAQLPGPVHR